LFLFFLCWEFGLGSSANRPEEGEGSVEQVTKVDSPISQKFNNLAVLLISNPYSDQLILFTPIHQRNFFSTDQSFSSIVCFSSSINSTRSLSELFLISRDDDSFVISLSVAIHYLKREDAFGISQNNDTVKRSKKTITFRCKNFFHKRRFWKYFHFSSQ
jgi:hypothetical protein